MSCSVDVHVGTLSKAAGSHGGFAACSSTMRSLLLNRGRAFVFSTALPVPVVAGALAALHIATAEVHACPAAAHVSFESLMMAVLWSCAAALP